MTRRASIDVGLVAAGLIFGYVGVPEAGGDRVELSLWWHYVALIATGMVVAVFSFLTGNRIPVHVVFDIEGERRRNPSGLFSAQNLRPVARNVLLACVVVLAWIIGAYGHGGRGSEEGVLRFLLLFDIGALLGVALCWMLLRLSTTRT